MADDKDTKPADTKPDTKPGKSADDTKPAKTEARSAAKRAVRIRNVRPRGAVVLRCGAGKARKKWTLAPGKSVTLSAEDFEALASGACKHVLDDARYCEVTGA